MLGGPPALSRLSPPLHPLHLKNKYCASSECSRPETRYCCCRLIVARPPQFGRELGRAWAPQRRVHYTENGRLAPIPSTSAKCPTEVSPIFRQHRIPKRTSRQKLGHSYPRFQHQRSLAPKDDKFRKVSVQRQIAKFLGVQNVRADSSPGCPPLHRFPDVVTAIPFSLESRNLACSKLMGFSP